MAKSIENLSELQKVLKSDYRSGSENWEQYLKFWDELIDAIGKSEETFSAGGEEYDLPRFVSVFANYLLVDFFNLASQYHAPHGLQGRVAKETRDELQDTIREIGEYGSAEKRDGAKTASKLREFLEKVEKARGGETSVEGGYDERAAATAIRKVVINELDQSINEVRKKIADVVKPLDNQDYRLNTEKAEKIEKAETEEDDAFKARKEEADRQVEKSRASEQEKLQKAIKELREKEYDPHVEDPVAKVIAETAEKSSFKDDVLEPLTASLVSSHRFIGETEVERGKVDEAAVTNWTREKLKDDVLPDLSATIDKLEIEQKKLIEAAQTALDALLQPAGAAAAAGVESGGAEAEEAKEEAEAQPTDREGIFAQYQKRIQEVRNYLSSAQKESDLFARLLLEELGITLKETAGNELARELDEYLAQRTTELRKLVDQDEDALPTADLDAQLSRATADLFAAFERARKRWEESRGQTGNVNAALVKQLQEEQAATTAAAPGEVTEEQARVRIEQISRFQQHLLVAAEAELVLKLKAAGITNEAQIQEILNTNRTFLLDTIRFKAFAAANLVDANGQPKTPSGSDLISMVSNEVEVFSQKLFVQMGRSQEYAHLLIEQNPEAQKRLSQQLHDMGYADADIQDIVSNLQSDRFKPLAAYIHEHGFDGTSGLQNLLYERRIVAQSMARDLAEQISSGDLSGLIQLNRNRLSDDDYQSFEKLMRRARKSVLSPTERNDLSRYFSQMLGPQGGMILASLTVSAMNEKFGRLYQILDQMDRGAGRERFFTAPLQSFSSTTPSSPAPTSTGDLSSNDKLMMEIALSSAYAKLAEAGANRAAIEVEITLIVHQYSTGKEIQLSTLGAQTYDRLELESESLGNEPPGSAKAQALRMQQGTYGTAHDQRAAQAKQMAQAQLAMQLMATGLNPALIAKTLLTTKEGRELLAKVVLGTTAAVAVPAGLLTYFLVNLPGAIIQGIGSAISSVGSAIGSAISSVGSALGLGGSVAQTVAPEVSHAAIIAGKDAGSQLNAAMARAKAPTNSAIRGAFNSSLNTGNSIVSQITVAGVSKGIVAATILGPLLFTAFFTIIVITVIGGSLNGYPFPGSLFASRYGNVASGDWPVCGNIYELYHPRTQGRVSPGGTAIDISGPIGTPVFTPFAGVVKYHTSPLISPSNPLGSAASYQGNEGYGNYVRIATDQGFDIILAHFVAFPPGKTDGTVETITAGQIVGFRGTTGNSSGPHVHYEVLPHTSGGAAPDIYETTPKKPPALTAGEYVTNGKCDLSSATIAPTQ